MTTTEAVQLMMTDAAEIQAQGEAEKYQAFTDKFKPALTTDDCYTPAPVYDAVLEWVRKEYSLGGAEIVRPFWPGGDYQAQEYPEGCAVVDNPPFSIISQVVRWYTQKGVRFFLFAPALTLFSGSNYDCGVTFICCGVGVIYENGAQVPTSFVTNMDTCLARTAPELYRLVDEASVKNAKAGKVSLPKYVYPDHIVTAAIAQRWCKYGVEWRLSASDCVQVSSLDAQKSAGKAIFGKGFLLSDTAAAERAAAERAAAERAAATRWPLSEREKAIIARLGRKSTENVEIQHEQAGGGGSLICRS